MKRMHEDEPAILPKHLMTPQIWNMDVDDGGWVDDKTMFVDQDRRCWLTMYAKVRTMCEAWLMFVERRQNGFHVWVPQGATWTLKHTDQVGFPVVEIHERMP